MILHNTMFIQRLLDACLHSSLILSPNDNTFVPVSFDKITMYLDGKSNDESVSIRGIMSARPVLHRFTGGDQFTFDGIIFEENTMQEIIILENIKLQNISEISHADLSLQTECSAFFDKLEAKVWLPNKTESESKQDFETVLTRYAIKPAWLEMCCPIFYKELPPPSQLCSSTFQDSTIRSVIEHGATEDDQILTTLVSDVASWTLQLLILSLKTISKDTFNSTEIRFDEIRKLIIPIHQKYVDALLSYRTLPDVCKIDSFVVQSREADLIRKYPTMISVIKLLASCGSHLAEILTGKLEALEWLFNPSNEPLLDSLYTIVTKSNAKLPFEALLSYLQSSKTSSQSRIFRVLEVGAGVGATTMHILECLLDFANTSGSRIEYVFTDISAFFFTKAQERFAKLLEEKNGRNLLRIVYDVVDLDQSPLSHRSLELESFDIVCAANVIHATKNVVHSTEYIRHFLVPGGLAIVLELTEPHPLLDFLFGLLPQWWSSYIDDPIRKPETRCIVSVEQWRQVFAVATGFEDFDYVCNPFGIATLIAQKSRHVSILNVLPEKKQSVWLIFCDNNKYQIGMKISTHLKQVYEEQNIDLVFHESNMEYMLSQEKRIDIRSFFQHLVSKYSLINIIFAWTLDLCPMSNENDDFLDMQENTCIALSRIIQAIVEFSSENRPKLFVLTSNAQSNAGKNLNPVQSPIVGFVRSLESEYPTQRVKLIDLQMINDEDVSPIFIEYLVNELCVRNSSFQSDQEVTLSEAEDHSLIRSIFSYDPLVDDENKLVAGKPVSIRPSHDCDQNPFELELPSSHSLVDLKWIPMEHFNETPLEDNQIIVRVHCIGLNFRDLLVVDDSHPALYQLGSNYNLSLGRKMGNEFSGTIVRVGCQAAKHFAPGERVCGTCVDYSAFPSHVIVDQYQVVKVPDNMNLSFQQLATIPVAFNTVLLALKERIVLRPDQTCLIHSAAGGVGLVAIQYCQMVGAQVIATVGTEEKRQFLREYYNIEHVFNSRDLSFVDEIRKVMPNGVDVIINSLTGPFLIASLSLLGPHGHFIELGKRDAYSNTMIGLFDLCQDSTLHVVDLLSWSQKYPMQFQELLRYSIDLIDKGLMQPISKITVFEPTDVVKALTTFKHGSHIGKLVLRITESNELLTLSPRSKRLSEIKCSSACKYFFASKTIFDTSCAFDCISSSKVLASC